MLRVQLASASRTVSRRRLLHATAGSRAVTPLHMPAMSPTMTEGGIASWKVKAGDAFSAGDVLLEIETDKATIDVEAQDDGIMGKIVMADGSKNIAVGQTIAMLAEEGDDISNIEVPAESSSSPAPPAESSNPAPSAEREPPSASPAKADAASTNNLAYSPAQHHRPLFPSVHRLLMANGVENADQIKGTGVRGMLTKGDVLAFLGHASTPHGTHKSAKAAEPAKPAAAKKEAAPKPLDGAAIRQLIVSTMLKNSVKPIPKGPTPDFDSIISDYIPVAPRKTQPTVPSPLALPKKSGADAYLDGLI
ncbi:single hybrid motif-containing protein [Cylindrobasidium torrendii FP15055 ss-10]|uniref:Single hybrid motif-containing protein n=1 Tax=Cylindrobasidium torrendii FP15055 ss-10 TaxID=1314674 RepID=A0A0D7BAU5_9AGAR|nr:single hybrid motif-containing protein [Cylindrobasidium torrendii FP15055 ss-10]